MTAHVRGSSLTHRGFELGEADVSWFKRTIVMRHGCSDRTNVPRPTH